MKLRAVNAPAAPLPEGGYAQAVEVTGATRRLYISGQIPMTEKGDVPHQFDEQARLVWHNLCAQLAAGGMGVENLVKVTTFLCARRYATCNSRIRQEFLDGHIPALTVIIADIYDEKWLLEVEAIAEA